MTFPTSQYGWAVGSAGSIWHTDNGGANWNSQSSGDTQSLGIIAAVGPRLVGRSDGEVRVHTEDDGATWKSQYKGDPTNDPTSYMLLWRL